MKKRVFAVAMTAAMVMSLVACGGSGDGGSSAADTGVSITIFNSKSEIQSQMEEMAERYTEEKGVNVEVYYSNDTVAAHMATKYASNDPYTIAMIDSKDVYSLGAEHALDLSDQDWVSHTGCAITVDGKVVGFPVCVEARGVMYNADAIEAITGETFVPENYATLDAFKGLIDQLKAGGMESPVGIMKEDWSMGAHYLCQVYEERDDVEGFISALHAGTADLNNDAKWTSLMDTFDVLKENNYAKDAPVAAEREISEQKLAEGEIAFMFGGNWDWAMINAYDYSENMGMMPVPQNMDDGTNTKLVGGGSKYFIIDSSENTSEEQVAAAKDFLNWLVSDPEGGEFLTVECALVPAFDTVDASALDPLSTSVKQYADAGALIDNYNYMPDDAYSVCGAAFQKYLAGEIDRAGLASEIEAYWQATAPVEH